MKRKQGGLWLAVLLSLFWAGCLEEHGEPESLLDRVTSQNKAVVYAESLDVRPDGNGGSLVSVGAGDSLFYLHARRTMLKGFPCSECHQNGKVEGKRDAHWEIEVKHAPGMKCATCHDHVSMDHLRGLHGESIAMDRSYNLCSQCHFQQVEDWKGGAHGKRLEGWKPPRVIQSCVECHNPHGPALEKRWPALIPPALDGKEFHQ